MFGAYYPAQAYPAQGPNTADVVVVLAAHRVGGWLPINKKDRKKRQPQPAFFEESGNTVRQTLMGVLDGIQEREEEAIILEFLARLDI